MTKLGKHLSLHPDHEPGPDQDCDLSAYLLAGLSIPEAEAAQAAGASPEAVIALRDAFAISAEDLAVITDTEMAKIANLLSELRK